MMSLLQQYTSFPGVPKEKILGGTQLTGKEDSRLKNRVGLGTGLIFL
jgi:hypothetical protein